MKLKYIVFILSMIILIGITAGSVQALFEHKSFDPVENSIEIKGWFNSKIAKLTLLENTYNCYPDCSAVIKLEVYKDFKIPNKNKDWDILFEGLENQEDLDIEILEGIQKTSWLTKWKPTNIFNRKFKKGEELLFTINGYKHKHMNIDWIPILAGLELTEWAEWGENNWQISGDSVYIDNDDALINITPHTIYNSGWVEFEFKPKQYTGNIDAAWGFDTNTLKPAKAYIYDPYEIIINESHVFYNVSSFIDSSDACELGNEYNNVKKEGTYLIYNSTGNKEYTQDVKVVCYDSVENLGNNDYKINWGTQETEDWKKFSVSNKIDYNFQGMNKWYLIKDKPVTAGQTYRVKALINAKVFPLYEKYYFALKPSSQTIQQAIQAGNFYYLDPWANVSGSVASIQFNEGAGDFSADEWYHPLNNTAQLLTVAGGGDWTWNATSYPVYNLTGNGTPYSVISSITGGAGARDYIYINNSQTDATNNDDSFSIAFWFKLGDAATEQRLFFGQKGDFSADEWLQIIYRLSPPRLSIEIRDSGGSMRIASNNFSDTTDWHSFVMLYNSSGASFNKILGWIDNVQNFTGDSADLWANRHPNFSVGSIITGTSVQAYQVDNLQIFDRLLNNTEALHFFNHGNVTGAVSPAEEPSLSAGITIYIPVSDKFYYSGNTTLQFNVSGGDTSYSCDRLMDGITEVTYNPVTNGTTFTTTFYNATVGFRNLSLECSGNVQPVTANGSVGFNVGDMFIGSSNYDSEFLETLPTNYTINITINPNVTSIDNMEITLVAGDPLKRYNATKSLNPDGFNVTANYTVLTPLINTNYSLITHIWNVTITYNNASVITNNTPSTNQYGLWAYSFPSVIADGHLVFEWDNIQANGTIHKKADNVITSMKFDLCCCIIYII